LEVDDLATGTVSFQDQIGASSVKKDSEYVLTPATVVEEKEEKEKDSDEEKYSGADGVWEEYFANEVLELEEEEDSIVNVENVEENLDELAIIIPTCKCDWCSSPITEEESSLHTTEGQDFCATCKDLEDVKMYTEWDTIIEEESYKTA